GDAEERVDPRWAAAAFQACDRRLRRPAQLSELALREAHLDAALRDAFGDLCKEPAAVARDDPLAEPLYRALDLCTGLRRHDKSIATLLCRDAVAHDRADGIAHTDPSGLHDCAVDAERQRLGTTVGAILRQRPEGVEVDLGRVRIRLRDDAAADVAGEGEDRVAALDSTADPLVLLVGTDAVDLEQHPDTTPVDLLPWTTH